MGTTRWLWMVASLVLLFGCPARPDTESDPSVIRGGGTVYGEDGSDGSNGSFDETTVESEDIVPYETSDDVDSENLAILDDEPGLDLDWEPVYFEFDKADLTKAAQDKLREYASMLQRYGELQVLLEGHCDSRGTEDYNLALGERRAQTVKRFFEQLGIPSSRLRTISYGELQPQIDEESERAWALNRRVAFTF